MAAHRKYATDDEARLARNARQREHYVRNKDYYRDWQKEHAWKRRAERRALVDRIKLERGCADCGYAEEPVALDFDHRDPSDKSFSVGAQLTGRLDLLLEEIAKCEVVCANCHRVRTYGKKVA